MKPSQPRRGEHVVPAWQFGHQRQCWQDGGRKTALKIRSIARWESDMHNLQPSVGEGEWRSRQLYVQPVEWRRRPVRSMRHEGRFQRKSCRTTSACARCHCAHLLLYARPIQPDTLSPANAAVQRMEQMYPVTDWECERDERIAKVQGNHNPYVQRAARRRKS